MNKYLASILSIIIVASSPSFANEPASTQKPSLVTPPKSPSVEALKFEFWRIIAFREMNKAKGCKNGDLDARLKAVRKKLEKKYGKDKFKEPAQPLIGVPPGDCYMLRMVYETNLKDFEHLAQISLDSK